jgi:signal transduction histidine kinase
VGLSKNLGLPGYGSFGAFGIREDELSHVFDRFYRTGNARARADGGSGLGLSICRTITEARGGTIMAQSEPNAGTTFEIHLPLSSACGTL